MITDRRKFTTKWSLYGTSSFHFLLLESIQNYSAGMYSVQEIDPNYRQRPMADIGTVRSCAAWLADMEEKQTELETENK